MPLSTCSGGSRRDSGPPLFRSVVSMDDQFAAGRDFILRQGRLLERRLFATCFEGVPAAGVVDAVRAFRNDDCGFGHGLEPDVRCPASLPVDVEVALQALVAAGAVDQALVMSACDYLAKVAAGAACSGAVPPAFPVIEGGSRGPRTGLLGPTSLVSTRRLGLSGCSTSWGWSTPGWTKRPLIAGPSWTCPNCLVKRTR
jgi:hypothetical protein